MAFSIDQQRDALIEQHARWARENLAPQPTHASEKLIGAGVMQSRLPGGERRKPRLAYSNHAKCEGTSPMVRVTHVIPNYDESVTSYVPTSSFRVARAANRKSAQDKRRQAEVDMLNRMDRHVAKLASDLPALLID